jgi:hypothetical protein
MALGIKFKELKPGEIFYYVNLTGKKFKSLKTKAISTKDCFIINAVFLDNGCHYFLNDDEEVLR